MPETFLLRQSSKEKHEFACRNSGAKSLHSIPPWRPEPCPRSCTVAGTIFQERLQSTTLTPQVPTDPRTFLPEVQEHDMPGALATHQGLRMYSPSLNIPSNFFQYPPVQTYNIPMKPLPLVVPRHILKVSD